MHQEAEHWAAIAATGGLTEPELKAWTNHVTTCPACQKLNDEEFAMGNLIKTTLDAESPDPGFEQRIIQKLNAARAGKGNRWSEVILFHPGLTTAAACLVLIAVAGAGALLHGPKPASTASSGPTDPGSLPAAVRTVLQHEFAGKTVTRIERNEGDGEISYSVSTNPRDPSEVDFTVAENGTLLSVDTTLETVPQVVRNAINAQVGKLDGIEKNFDNGEISYVATILSPDGHPRDYTFNEDGALTSMEVSPEEVPAAVRTALKAQVGRGLVGGIDKTFDNGETSYVATIISQGGRPRDFTFNEDGTLSSMEVSPGELPDSVKAAIRAQVGRGRLAGVDKTFDDGEVTYEASTIGADGRRHSFSLSEEGKLLSREIAINETPDAVRQTISRILEKGKVIEINQTFDEPNNIVPFEIEGWKDGKPFYFLVSPTGDFLGMED